MNELQFISKVINDDNKHTATRKVKNFALGILGEKS